MLSNLSIQEFEFVTDAWLADVGPERVIEEMRRQCDYHGISKERQNAKAIEIRLVYAEMDVSRTQELLSVESLEEQLENLRKLKKAIREERE